jgi:hypothetical protein
MGVETFHPAFKDTMSKPIAPVTNQQEAQARQLLEQ